LRSCSAGRSGVELAFALVGARCSSARSGSGPANAAIQAVTPGRMRGTTTAIYIAIYNVIGYGLGPLLGRLAQRPRVRRAGDRPSIVVLALLSGPLGLLFAWTSLRPYAREIEAAEARGD
jgi:MFS family permease